MADFDNRPDVKQQSGESLELGHGICRRYGNSPGVARLPDAPMVVDRCERFTAQHLPLLATLQRRWSHSALMPKGWAAPIYVRPVFPAARVRSMGIGRPVPRATLRAVSIQPGEDAKKPAPQISSGSQVGKGREELPSPPAPANSRKVGSDAAVAVSAAKPAEFGPPVFRRRLHKAQISGNRQTETGIRRDPNPVVESRPEGIKPSRDNDPEVLRSTGTAQRQAEVEIAGGGGHSPEASAYGSAAGSGTEGAAGMPKIQRGASLDAGVERVSLSEAKFAENAQTRHPGPVETVQFRPEGAEAAEAPIRVLSAAEMIQLRPSTKPVKEPQESAEANAAVGGPESFSAPQFQVSALPSLGAPSTSPVGGAGTVHFQPVAPPATEGTACAPEATPETLSSRVQRYPEPREESEASLEVPRTSPVGRAGTAHFQPADAPATEGAASAPDATPETLFSTVRHHAEPFENSDAAIQRLTYSMSSSHTDPEVDRRHTQTHLLSGIPNPGEIDFSPSELGQREIRAAKLQTIAQVSGGNRHANDGETEMRKLSGFESASPDLHRAPDRTAGVNAEIASQFYRDSVTIPPEISGIDQLRARTLEPDVLAPVSEAADAPSNAGIRLLQPDPGRTGDRDSASVSRDRPLHPADEVVQIVIPADHSAPRGLSEAGTRHMHYLKSGPIPSGDQPGALSQSSESRNLASHSGEHPPGTVIPTEQSAPDGASGSGTQHMPYFESTLVRPADRQDLNRPQASHSEPLRTEEFPSTGQSPSVLQRMASRTEDEPVRIVTEHSAPYGASEPGTRHMQHVEPSRAGAADESEPLRTEEFPVTGQSPAVLHRMASGTEDEPVRIVTGHSVPNSASDTGTRPMQYFEPTRVRSADRQDVNRPHASPSEPLRTWEFTGAGQSPSVLHRMALSSASRAPHIEPGPHANQSEPLRTGETPGVVHVTHPVDETARIAIQTDHPSSGITSGPMTQHLHHVEPGPDASQREPLRTGEIPGLVHATRPVDETARIPLQTDYPFSGSTSGTIMQRLRRAIPAPHASQREPLRTVEIPGVVHATRPVDETARIPLQTDYPSSGSTSGTITQRLHRAIPAPHASQSEPLRTGEIPGVVHPPSASPQHLRQFDPPEGVSSRDTVREPDRQASQLHPEGMYSSAQIDRTYAQPAQSSRISLTQTNPPHPSVGNVRPVVNLARHADEGLPRPVMVHGPHPVQRVADASGGPRMSNQPGINEASGNPPNVSRGGERIVNRAIAPVAPNASNPGMAAAPQSAAEAKRPRSPASDIDVNGVVDQVYQMLVRRLASERLRKGL